MVIQKALKRALEDQGWTLTEAAEHSEVARATVSRILAGRHKPTLRTVGRLKRGIPGLASLLETPDEQAVAAA